MNRHAAAVAGGAATPEERLQALLTELLTPIRSSFSDVGIFVNPPDDVELLDASTLLDPLVLRATLERFSPQVGTDDLRIVGVHWLGQLGYALLPPIEIALSGAGIGLDASLRNLLIVQPDGKPTQIALRDTGGTFYDPERCPDPALLEEIGTPLGSHAAVRDMMLRMLYTHNLIPLVNAIIDLTGVPPQAIWGQIAYEGDLFYGAQERQAPETHDAVWESDRAAMFASRTWSAAQGENPLYAPTRLVLRPHPETGEPREVKIRSTCCLIYKVPDARMCSGCPLRGKHDLVREKLATVDERRAVMAAGGGGAGGEGGAT